MLIVSHVLDHCSNMVSLYVNRMLICSCVESPYEVSFNGGTRVVRVIFKVLGAINGVPKRSLARVEFISCRFGRDRWYKAIHSSP